MKKFAKAAQAIGFIICILALCADSESLLYQFFIVIAFIFGALIIRAGFYIENEWVFEEDDDFKLEDHRSDNTDDGITYIEYDIRGRLIFLDKKEKVLPPTKVTEPIQESE